MRRAVDILLNDTPQPSNNTWHTSFDMALRTHLYAFSIVLTLTLLRRKERGTLWFKILWWTGGRSVRLSIFLDQSFASYHKNLFACLSHTETYGATSVISSWRHKKIEMKYQWRGCHIYIKLYTRHSAKSTTIPFKGNIFRYVLTWPSRLYNIYHIVRVRCKKRKRKGGAPGVTNLRSVFRIFIYYSR